MGRLETEILERIARAAETGRAPEGVLFHGTCEEIDGPLRGGGYDGVLWTADSPVIAQQYIPASGSSVLVSRPFDYEMQDRVRPDPNSWWHSLARRISGLECAEVEIGRNGRAESWRVPKGWPTYADCVRHVEEVLGYAQEGYGGYEIRQDLVDGEFVDRPCGWLKQGHVFATLSAGLRFKDMRRSEDGDLTELEYHDVEGFEAAAAEGYDGVMINDFAQVDGHGNVGHVSWGLLPGACAGLEWVRIPAVRRPLAGSWLTADVLAWAEGAGCLSARAPAPS